MSAVAPTRARASVRRAFLLPVILASVLTLTACSGGNPGPNEVKQAMLNNPQFMAAMDMMAQASAALTGEAAKTGEDLIRNGQVEVGSCAAASGASGVVCDFRTGADGKFGGWTKARFFQANGQWQMEKM